MKQFRYLGLIAGMTWGLIFTWGTAHSTRSHLIGEGQYVLIVIALPLAVIGLIHTAINGRVFRLPLLYAAALALLLAGELIAYRIIFQSDGPKLGRSLVAVSVGFVASFAVLSVVPGLRTIMKRIAEPGGGGYDSPAVKFPRTSGQSP